MADILVNAVGEACPMPVVKANKALKEMKEAGTVEVHVDNETAVQNLCRLAESKKLQASGEKKADNLYIVKIRVEKPLAEEEAGEEFEASCTMDRRKNLVVAITANHMGEGNAELGKVLIKGYIYALSQLDELPKTILFYNGGATLTAEGSASLADLKNLEAQGVEILTCGTCLDYYGLKEKLVVGNVTNMYTIAEKMAGADRLVRP